MTYAHFELDEVLAGEQLVPAPYRGEAETVTPLPTILVCSECGEGNFRAATPVDREDDGWMPTFVCTLPSCEGAALHDDFDLDGTDSLTFVGDLLAVLPGDEDEDDLDPAEFAQHMRRAATITDDTED